MTIAPHFGSEISGATARRTPLLRLLFGFLAGATDAATILLLSIGTGVLYHRILYGESGVVSNYVQVGILAGWLYLIVNAYRFEYSVTKYLEFKKHPERIVRTWNLTFVCLIMLGFLTKTTDVHSRGWLILFYASAIPAIAIVHALFVRAVMAGSQIGLLAAKRLFLVGREHNIREFLRRYRSWDLWLEIAGIACLAPPGRPGNSEGGLRFEDDLNTAVARARTLDLDGVFVAVPWHDQDTIDRCVDAFMTVPTSIYLAPERLLDRFESVAIEQIGPIASLHLLRPPLSFMSVLVKRLLDIMIAAIALLVLFPLLVFIGVLVKYDSPGPILFMQRRYGFNQKPFRILKFRTMTTLEDGAIVRQAAKHDTRMTRVGQVLRRWNIDELPQLVNVLMGDMSLVGPRPHALAHDHAWGEKIALYARRHNVKPGITGWAQINGFRGNIDTDDQLQQRIECDLYYIDNWSVWLDLRILFATVFFPKAYKNAL